MNITAFQELAPGHQETGGLLQGLSYQMQSYHQHLKSKVT